MIMVPVVIVLALLAVIYKYLTTNYDYWKSLNVVFREPVAGFGNLKSVLLGTQHAAELFKDIYDEFPTSNVVGVYMFRNPVLLVRDLDLVEEVLQTNFSNFHDNGIIIDPTVDPMSSCSPFFARGERWRQMRSHQLPSFTNARIRDMHLDMTVNAGKLVDTIRKLITEKPSQWIDAYELAAKYTSQNGATCGFGLDGSCLDEELSHFRAITRDILGGTLWHSIELQLLSSFPFLTKPLNLRFIPKSVEDKLIKICREAIEYRTKNGVKKNDILNQLIMLRDTEGVSYQYIAGHAASFLLEIFATSSTALSCALFEISQNAYVADKLRREIDETHEKYGENIPLDVLQELPYLEMVALETLRMYPPLMATSRTVTNDCNLGGVALKAGEVVIVPILAIHRDPEIYPEPTRFNPDRFENNAIENRHKMSFLAFGAGPRTCPGARIGLTQLKIALSTLARNFRIAPALKEGVVRPLPVQPGSLIMIVKGGVPVEFYPRAIRT